MRWRPLLLCTLLTACAADDGGSGEETGGDEPEEVPTEGLVGCAAGETCTLVLVSQTLDDRIEVYEVGAGDAYRGALDVDFKPNPDGDYEGEALDEPFGLALSGGQLHALVGHYPAADSGSLISVDYEALTGVAAGETLPNSSLLDGGSPQSGVELYEFDVLEPLFVEPHPSGRIVVGVFANDLFAPPQEWTAPAKIIVVDPESFSFAVGPDLADCAGGWSLVSLADGDRMALACDGDEGVKVLDTSQLGEGSVEDAAQSVEGCLADVAFMDRRVRWVARGQGGDIVFVDSTASPMLGETTRLWVFDRSCEMQGFADLEGERSWDVRGMVRLAGQRPRWVVARARGEDRGVIVLEPGEDAPVECARVGAIDELIDSAGAEIHPVGIAADPSAGALAVGLAELDLPSDTAGEGHVAWIDFGSDDPCDDTATLTMLSDDAPTFAVDEPSTWGRAPALLEVVQVRGASD